MKTDNELIAEFMGWVRYKAPGGWAPTWRDTHGNNQREMKYDTSWEWLMPVVEKINKLYDQESEWMSEYEAVVSRAICTPIDQVFNSVTEFIKWYNENKE